MAIDSSIYSNIGRGVKSVADYENEAATSRQNKLAEIMDGMKMDEARRGIADDAAVRQAYQQSGGDQNKLMQTLQNTGQYKAGQALQKSMLDSQKLKDDSAKTQAETLDKTLGSFRSYVPQITTPEAAGQYTAAMYDHPVLGKFAANFGSREDAVKRNMDAFAKDPRAWTTGAAGLTADKLLETMKGTRQNTNVGGNLKGETIDYFGGVVPSQTTYTPITQDANNAATVNNAAQTAQMVDDRARDQFGATVSKPFEVTGPDGSPVLVRQDKTGNVAAVPGFGPKSGSAKLTEDQGKATGWLVQAENAFGNMKGAMERTPSSAKPGINDAIGGIYGLGGVANSMRGADRQQFVQGASSLSEALLRAATGAGVNKDEAVQKIQELTPVFGEADATTKQKMAAIPLYIESLKVRSGPGAKQVPGIFDRVNAAAAAAPAAQQDGAVSKSKSGKDIVMRGGKWEYK